MEGTHHPHLQAAKHVCLEMHHTYTLRTQTRVFRGSMNVAYGKETLPHIASIPSALRHDHFALKVPTARTNNLYQNRLPSLQLGPLHFHTVECQAANHFKPPCFRIYPDANQPTHNYLSPDVAIRPLLLHILRHRLGHRRSLHFHSGHRNPPSLSKLVQTSPLQFKRDYSLQPT